MSAQKARHNTDTERSHRTVESVGQGSATAGHKPEAKAPAERAADAEGIHRAKRRRNRKPNQKSDPIDAHALRRLPAARWGKSSAFFFLGAAEV